MRRMICWIWLSHWRTRMFSSFLVLLPYLSHFVTCSPLRLVFRLVSDGTTLHYRQRVEMELMTDPDSDVKYSWPRKLTAWSQNYHQQRGTCTLMVSAPSFFSNPSPFTSLGATLRVGTLKDRNLGTPGDREVREEIANGQAPRLGLIRAVRGKLKTCICIFPPLYFTWQRCPANLMIADVYLTSDLWLIRKAPQVSEV